MADRKEKVDELLRQIEEGTKAVFESERYKAMMDTMAKFTRYSVNNCLLISMQRSNATLVCGYKGWQEKFHRQVRKGMSELQTIKTLVHEIAHGQCHNVAPDSPDYVPLDRATKECEAESIAYVVCQHFGLDTSDYSLLRLSRSPRTSRHSGLPSLSQPLPGSDSDRQRRWACRFLRCSPFCFRRRPVKTPGRAPATHKASFLYSSLFLMSLVHQANVCLVLRMVLNANLLPL